MGARARREGWVRVHRARSLHGVLACGLHRTVRYNSLAGFIFAKLRVWAKVRGTRTHCGDAVRNWALPDAMEIW
jgi:hypothetical protein